MHDNKSPWKHHYPGWQVRKEIYKGTKTEGSAVASDGLRVLGLWGLIASSTGSSQRAVIQRRNNAIPLALKHWISVHSSIKKKHEV